MAIITETDGDAAAEIAGVSYRMALGDTFEGTFKDNEDVDMVRVELSADTIYDFRLTADNATDATRLALTLYDNAGNEIRSGVDMPGGTVLILRPPADGTYYLKAHAPFQGVTGNYRITLLENTIPVGTYDDLARYLLEGYWIWKDDYRSSSGRKLGRTDADGAVTVTVYIDALEPAHQPLARQALEAWEDVSAIRFEEVGSANAADMPFRHVDGGISYGGTDGVQMSRGAELSNYIHEIGHALGLGHSGAYPAPGEPLSLHQFGAPGMVYLLDSKQASIMSYIASNRNSFIDADYYVPATPMIADIIAIQTLYGAPVEGARPGDTVYGYQSNVEGDLGDLFVLWSGELNPLVDVHMGLWSYPTLADLDGDGDADLVVHGGEPGASIEYYENTGGPGAPAFTQRTGADNPFADIGEYTFGGTRFADLDGDGDLDLFLFHFGYYENVGDATHPEFVDRTWTDNPLADLREMDAGYNTPYLADLDNDADLDVVLPDYDRDARHHTFNYIENTGDAQTPVFTLRAGEANPFAGITSVHASIAFADMDGDRDLDLVMGWGEDGALEYHENTGSLESPAFTQVTGGDNPFEAPTARYYGISPALADLDGDGDLDLVTGRWNGVVYYFENMGASTQPAYRSTQYASNTHGGPGLTLYDTGGTDTLDVRTGHAPQVIDLRPEGVSSVYGARGNLVIARGTVIENAVAGHGDDTLIGNSADNVLTGGPGADRLDGGPGQDTADYRDSPAGVSVRLQTGQGAGGHAQGDTLANIEHLAGSAFDDILGGHNGANTLRGDAGNDGLWGSGGSDALSGGPGNDRLVGGGGADTLTGGPGADRLDGGPGDDQLDGGPGLDTFVFAPGDGADEITDFTSGEDRIDLSAFELDSAEAVTVTDQADGVSLDLPGQDGGSVLLAGLDTGPAPDDFIV